MAAIAVSMSQVIGENFMNGGRIDRASTVSALRRVQQRKHTPELGQARSAPDATSVDAWHARFGGRSPRETFGRLSQRRSEFRPDLGNAQRRCGAKTGGVAHAGCYALGLEAGSASNRPLALAVVSGLTSSTLLSLFLVPVMFVLLAARPAEAVSPVVVAEVLS